jgi:pyruvate-formate lyase-activating enzyme
MIGKTKKRVLTRRGVIWLGQTCNQRCYFCYFINRIEDHKHPEHAFMSLDKAKKICHTLRYFYGNTAIDIQGGEPTLYHGIKELVHYCREIGLYPTLITNGLMLAKPGLIEAYRDAGLRDFLVSLHGVGEIHNEVVRVKNAYSSIRNALTRMRDLRFPFRINCTMSKPVIPILAEVARHAVEYGADAVNYIAFNPFADQESGRRSADTVPCYSDVSGPLAEAMDLLEGAGIEVNVRYMPLCMARGKHLKHFYNFQQLPYDTHEWDFQSWTWSMSSPQMRKEGGLMPPFLIGGPYSRNLRNGDALYIRDHYERSPVLQGFKFLGHRLATRIVQKTRGMDAIYRDEARYRAAHDCLYKYHDACDACAAKNICDGFHGDYAELFGTLEAQPIERGMPIDDPVYYIREQEKTVEKEDMSWAL